MNSEALILIGGAFGAMTLSAFVWNSLPVLRVLPLAFMIGYGIVRSAFRSGAEGLGDAAETLAVFTVLGLVLNGVLWLYSRQ